MNFSNLRPRLANFLWWWQKSQKILAIVDFWVFKLCRHAVSASYATLIGSRTYAAYDWLLRRGVIIIFTRIHTAGRRVEVANEERNLNFAPIFSKTDLTRLSFSDFLDNHEIPTQYIILHSHRKWYKYYQLQSLNKTFPGFPLKRCDFLEFSWKIHVQLVIKNRTLFCPLFSDRCLNFRFYSLEVTIESLGWFLAIFWLKKDPNFWLLTVVLIPLEELQSVDNVLCQSLHKTSLSSD